MESIIGKTIAGYQVIELIDDAARTMVYKAYNQVENRYVAIKVLKTDPGVSATAVQSFTQYAQLAARMQHPNILPVLTSGEENGLYYLVEPFMEHFSVAQNRSVYHDLYQAQSLIQAVLPSLEYLYGQGVVHGNLRSTNILLGDQWQPLLVDFGITMRQGDTPTPYNSPEQVQGGVIDRRTDVYALGILLFELLSGQLPVPGTMFTLANTRPDLPAGVEQVILKATAQNPDQRYPSPREMLNALQIASRPAEAPVATPVPPTVAQNVPVQEPKSHTNWSGIIIGGIVIIVIVLVIALALPKLLAPSTPAAQVTQPEAGQPLETPVVEPTEPPVQPTAPPVETAAPAQTLEPGSTPSGGGGITLPSVCGSLGVGGGIVFLGGALNLRRRKRS